jgi:hypothetical protein
MSMRRAGPHAVRLPVPPVDAGEEEAWFGEKGEKRGTRRRQWRRFPPPSCAPRGSVGLRRLAVLVAVGAVLFLARVRSLCSETKCAARSVERGSGFFVHCCLERWWEHDVLCNAAYYLGCRPWTEACNHCWWMPPERRMMRPCCTENVRAIVRHVTSNLAANNITFWIDRGLLISSLRLGDLQPWDKDGDIAVVVDPDGQVSRLRTADEAQAEMERIFGAGGRGDDAKGTGPGGFYFRGADIARSGRNRHYVDFFMFTWVGHGPYYESERERARIAAEGFRFAPAHPGANRTHMHCAMHCHPSAMRPRDAQNLFPLQSCLLFGKPVPCPRRPVDYLVEFYGGAAEDFLEPRYVQFSEEACPGDPHCGRDFEADVRMIREAMEVHARQGWPTFLPGRQQGAARDRDPAVPSPIPSLAMAKEGGVPARTRRTPPLPDRWGA